MSFGRNGIRVVAVALFASLSAAGDIELRKTIDAASGNVEVKTVFQRVDERLGKVISEGLCQPAPVDGECNRNFPELEIVRSVPAQKYRTKLAEIFGIEPALAIREDALAFIDSQMQLEESQGNSAAAKSLGEVMNRLKDLENITKYLKADKSVSIVATKKSFGDVELPFGRITGDDEKKGYALLEKRLFTRLNMMTIEFYLMAATSRAGVSAACPAGTVALDKAWVRRLGNSVSSPGIDAKLKELHGGKEGPWEVWLSDSVVDMAKIENDYRNSWRRGNERPAGLFPPPYAGGTLFAGSVYNSYDITGTTFYAELSAKAAGVVKSSAVSVTQGIGWGYKQAFQGSAVQTYQAEHQMKPESELRATIFNNASGTLPVLCLDY